MENYSLGLTLVFLTEVHPYDHMDAITAYWNELLSRQKANGAWGYPNEPRGDTSQLQYAALAAWSAKAVGVEVPPDVMRQVGGLHPARAGPERGVGLSGK